MRPALLLPVCPTEMPVRRREEMEEMERMEAGMCDEVIQILYDKFQREKSHKRCGSDPILTAALEEEVRRDWTLEWAIRYLTGDSTYDGFMKYVRSQTSFPDLSNIPVDKWDDIETDRDAYPLLLTRILQALDKAPITGNERFWLFRGSIGDFNNTLFSATTSVHHALEYVTRARLREDAVLQVYEIDASIGHQFLPVHAVSEYGESECEVLVYGKFRKSCELHWKTPLHYSVRVCLYK